MAQTKLITHAQAAAHNASAERITEAYEFYAEVCEHPTRTDATVNAARRAFQEAVAAESL